MHYFFQAIKVCLKDKLFITGGRAGRMEFWLFTLFAVAVRLALYPLTTIQYFGVVYSIINFIVFVAHYTAIVRRLHDSGRTGLHLAPVMIGLLMIFAGFVVAIPMAVTAGEVLSGLGIIYLLVLCALPGNPNANEYGPAQPLPAKQ